MLIDRPFKTFYRAPLTHEEFSKIAMDPIITTKEHTMGVVSKALDMKRAFLTAWEIQFLNSIRVSGLQPEDLTQQQMVAIGVIGKRLGLIE